MDSNKIKNLAFGARDALRREAAARIESALAEGSTERLERSKDVKALEASIKESGLEKVVDSSAYTWFNRFCALRYMDAHGYTPVGVVTPRPGSTQPAILADAAQGIFDPDWAFDRLTRDRVTALLSGTASASNPTEEAYAELLRGVCAYYSGPMPYLFDRKAASPLAMPQGLLAEGSILRVIVEEMDDDACSSVEVLGWLYQFYIAERKAEFNNSDRKATADDIAPATQLFTPDWIVKYLVENSLGRLWMLNNPGSSLAEKMDYYIAPEGEVEDYIKVYSPEELTLCDPACGSGHILVYAFELLFEIYQEEGYLPEDIPALILQNNLFGMEIDGRAAEIAKFALEMKAREKDPGFFDKCIDANVTVLETVEFAPGELAGAGPIAGATDLLDAFKHMTEVGSLYVPAPGDMAAVDNAITSLNENDLLGAQAIKKLRVMRGILKAISHSVQCVVANPPYLPTGSMQAWANEWLKKKYPCGKPDLCTCFIERGFILSRPRGYVAMVTMQAWLFLDSYKKLRSTVIGKKTITTLVQLGTRAFDSISGEKVSTAAFTLFNGPSATSFLGSYIQLTRPLGEHGKSSLLLSALSGAAKDICYSMNQAVFLAITDAPFAYWATQKEIEVFQQAKKLSDLAETYRGLQPGDVPEFVRAWFELAVTSIGDCRVDKNKTWAFMSSGGRFRKWYGNLEKAVCWGSHGERIKRCKKAIIPNEDYYGDEVLGWSRIGSESLSLRLYPAGLIPGDATGSIKCTSVQRNYVQALLNSTVIDRLWPMMNPNMTNSTGIVSKVPVQFANSVTEQGISSLVKSNIQIAKDDWDAFESSWDFEWHPLAPSARDRADQLSLGMNSGVRTTSVSLISKQFERWSAECDDRFNELKANEEELNRIFARIYGMEGEVPIEVADDKVSVRRADLVRDVKSLVSYGVGCIMGRYSTFAPGLILADAKQTVDDFREKVPGADFLPDEDAIVPMLDGEWFDDDIVAQFRMWLEVTYGRDTLEENVRFIEGALGKDLRKYFVKDFYKDHCATYQVTGSGKRPIYWMFASPKGGFQALVYMHRYTPSTVGQILTGYLREYIQKLNASIAALDGSDRAADKRQADKYRTVVRELDTWERDVIYPLANERVFIDLDDGVKKNYNKFPHALAKVSGLSEWK